MDKELEHSKLDDTQSIQTQDEENIKQVLVVERVTYLLIFLTIIHL